MKAEAHFPPDYKTARANFIAAADARDLGTTARLNPNAKTRDGKNLFLDTTIVGKRDAKKTLLMISATHGVEGYFGSGVQTGMLREGIEAPKGAKIVMLHALNPYGFAWDRRVNEDNADINRNFVDHKKPPANKDYARMAQAISPRDLSKAAWKAANAVLRAYSEKHGAFALQEAITKGQYKYPDGIYYGGAKESWSAAMLRDVCREELRDVKKLIVIDFHTGLGPFGYGEMISEDMPGSAAYKRAKKMWGDRVCSAEAGESVSAPLNGTVDKAVAKFLPDTQLTFAALEAGTIPSRDVFNALRKDNFLHRFAGGKHKDAEAIRRACRDAFYCDAPEWKRKVWKTANEVVKAALDALA